MNSLKPMFWMMLCFLIGLGGCRSKDCIGDIPGETANSADSGANNNNPGTTPTDPGNTNPGGGTNLEPKPPVQLSPEEQIVQAIQNGEIDSARTLLLVDPTLVKTIDEETGASLLIIATQFNKPTMVQFLIRLGIDTELTDKEGNNAAFYADELGNELLVSLINGELTEEGINIAFLEETEKSNIDGLKFLIDLGADVNTIDEDNGGRGALTIAIGKGEIDLIQFLLEQGVSTMLKVRGRDITASDYARRTRATEEVIAFLENWESSNP
ncbi:MAG: ankyrin repeat domain-containing protein [Pseudobacteriovorax sp.]|nr:ankyrin repeat domain-containing protein [Pseudobacteriovorax sp.]